MPEDRLASLLATLEPSLQTQVLALETAVRAQPTDRETLRTAMAAVLTSLTGPGRTDVHCKGVALYFIVAKATGLDRSHLPADLGALMDDLAGALHDAVSSPKSAENFQATPEILLDRLTQLP